MFIQLRLVGGQTQVKVGVGPRLELYLPTAAFEFHIIFMCYEMSFFFLFFQPRLPAAQRPGEE